MSSKQFANGVCPPQQRISMSGTGKEAIPGTVADVLGF